MGSLINICKKEVDRGVVERALLQGVPRQDSVLALPLTSYFLKKLLLLNTDSEFSLLS